MTLSTSGSIVAPSVITLLLLVSLGSLASLVNIIIYVFFLHQCRKSILDDQACVLAFNAALAGSLLSSLLSLGYIFHLKVFLNHCSRCSRYSLLPSGWYISRIPLILVAARCSRCGK